MLAIAIRSGTQCLPAAVACSAAPAAGVRSGSALSPVSVQTAFSTAMQTRSGSRLVPPSQQAGAAISGAARSGSLLRSVVITADLAAGITVQYTLAIIPEPVVCLLAPAISVRSGSRLAGQAVQAQSAAPGIAVRSATRLALQPASSVVQVDGRLLSGSRLAGGCMTSLIAACTISAEQYHRIVGISVLHAAADGETNMD